MELIRMTVQGLSVIVKQKNEPDSFYVEARGFGWLICRSYQADDWRPIFYEFVERLMSTDFAHLAPHPDQPL